MSVPPEQISGGAATQVAQQMGLTPEQTQQARDMVTPKSEMEPIAVGIPEFDQENPTAKVWHELTGPDGNRYGIHGPAGSTREEAAWLLYGMSEDQRAAYSLGSIQQQSPEIDAEVPEHSRKRSFLEGALVGWGTEATAAAAASIAKVATMAPGEQAGEDSSFGDVYRDILASEVQQLDEYRDIDPWGALGFELAGGVGSAMTAWGRLGAGAKTIPQMTKVGAGYGAAYGAGADHENRLKGAAIGGGMGIVATPPLAMAGREIAKIPSRFQRRKIKKQLKTDRGRRELADKLEERIVTRRAVGESAQDSWYKSVDEAGLEWNDIRTLENTRGAPFGEYAITRQEAMDYVAANNLLKKGVSQTGIMKSFDNLFEPVVERIAIHSPRLGQMLRNYEGKVYLDVHNWHEELSPFIEMVRKELPKTDRETLGKLMYNEQFDEARTLIRLSIGDDAVTKFDDGIQTINKVADLMEAHGARIDRVPNYFPRRVKDLQGLKDELGTDMPDTFKAILNKLESGSTNATSNRVGQALQVYMRGLSKTKKKETALRSRKVREINDEMYGFYEDPVASLDLWLRDASQFINRRKLFANNKDAAKVKSWYATKGVEDKETKVELIDDSIDKFLDEFGTLDDASRKEVAQLLKVRFGTGEKGMSPLYSNIRAIGHNSLIGDVVAAGTQLGDIGVSAWMNGFLPTVRSIFGKNTLTADDLGVMRELVSEISDPGSMQKFSNDVFKWSGFRSVDRLGKTVAINSSFKKYTRMAKRDQKKFIKEHGEMWGDDLPQLVDDLENDRITDLTKQFLFSKLSEMQPISRSEMPEKFLQMQDGRIFYQLSTWTMKQFSLFRKKILSKARTGNAKQKAEAMKDMMTAIVYIGGANVTADEVKRLITARESDFNNVDNFGDLFYKLVSSGFKNFTGLSEYTITKGEIGSMSMPAGGVVTRISQKGQRAYEQEDPAIVGKEVIKSLPLFGKMTYYWLLGGAEEFNKKEADKRRQTQNERWSQ